jgi:hypothetical protein
MKSKTTVDDPLMAGYVFMADTVIRVVCLSAMSKVDTSSAWKYLS